MIAAIPVSLIVTAVVLFLAIAVGKQLLAGAAAATRSAPATETFPYFKVEYLCTPTEQGFYRALLEAVGDRCTVMSKVRLAAVLDCSKEDWRAGHGNRIDKKELDFVLVEPLTTRIVAAIELDDRSHERPKRRARDAFLDRAMAAANVPLLRFRPSECYDPRDISSAVREATRGDAAAPLADEIPVRAH